MCEELDAGRRHRRQQVRDLHTIISAHHRPGRTVSE
jgi:hypothetical protein